jgi:hypothetical protein
MRDDIRCQIRKTYFDYVTGKNIIVLETEDNREKQLNSLKDKDVRCSIKQWKERRSLDANAYYWVIIGKLAATLHTSTTELHNRMISDYGQPEIIDGSLVHFILLDTIPWDKLNQIHLKPTAKTKVLDDGKLYRVYWVMRGSSTYNTKEMSILIEGLVSECKQAEIETLPPEELRRMLRAYKPKANPMVN